ncbi:MAG: thioredoxin domain-containing protein [Phycisphaeraceae bacterium]|nr:thioredoxin domain-containing protein [Phycisphaeraceae bacterium]
MGHDALTGRDSVGLDTSRGTDWRRWGDGMVPLLLLAAAAIAVYLASLSITGGSIAGCGPGSACDGVLRSRWSVWFGLPVSAAAAAVHLGTLAAWMVHRLRRPSDPRAAAVVLTAGAIVLTTAAAWFTGLMLAIGGGVCPWCLTSHGLGLAAGALAITSAARSRRIDGSRTARQVWIPAAMIASLVMLLLVVGQLSSGRRSFSLHSAEPTATTSVRSVAELADDNGSLDPPPLPVITPARGGEDARVSPVPDQPYDQSSGEDRTITLSLSLASLRPASMPRMGPADAKHVLVFFSDYTCPHCRRLHKMLLQARERYGRQLAVVHVLVPLNGRCNRLYSKATMPARHDQACEYTRLGLAVWRASPSAFEKFEHWMADPNLGVTPTLAEAINFAVTLVDRGRLEEAIKDPWIDQQIRRNVDLFDAAPIPSKMVPVLAMERRYLNGTPDDEGQLFAILEQVLGVHPAESRDRD